MLGPSGSYTSNPDYWGSNRKRVSDLVRRATQKQITTDDLGFFAGTMFWVRARCVRELLQFIDPEDFEEEAGQRDGTFAHVLERSIPMLVHLAGWELYETDSARPMEPRVAQQRTLSYFRPERGR
jgi:lipopolysaccharide biosynthesis protein